MHDIIKLSSSHLPTAFGEFLIHVYQDSHTLIEHVALVMGDIHAQKDVLTRVHSECLTGDIFASRRCDCGEQLALSQKQIAQAGQGIIVYLRDHEGRGIGLANKIRAYALQDKGLDTVEANLALGLPIDSRSFKVASDILFELGVQSIKLLSNNPAKCEALKNNGTKVSELVPLKVASNKTNKQYLRTKKTKLGHLLGE